MIYGESVRLRGIERTDIPTFVRWFNDPEVRRYLLMFSPMSTALEERWFETRLQNSSVTISNEYFFAIETHIDPEWVHIGNVSLAGIDWRNRTATLGLAIGEKAYWGKGFGTDATRTMVRFAFHDLNLHRVELEVFADNPRAIRVYEKVGFVREGTKRQALFMDGHYIDAHWMAILNTEFAAKP